MKSLSISRSLTLKLHCLDFSLTASFLPQIKLLQKKEQIKAARQEFIKLRLQRVCGYTDALPE